MSVSAMGWIARLSYGINLAAVGQPLSSLYPLHGTANKAPFWFIAAALVAHNSGGTSVPGNLHMVPIGEFYLRKHKVNGCQCGTNHI
jgi:hypothetical protein